MKSTKLLLAPFAIFIITSMLLTASGGSTTEEAAPEEAAPKTEGVQVGIVLPTKNEPRWIQDEARFE